MTQHRGHGRETVCHNYSQELEMDSEERRNEGGYGVHTHTYTHTHTHTHSPPLAVVLSSSTEGIIFMGGTKKQKEPRLGCSRFKVGALRYVNKIPGHEAIRDAAGTEGKLPGQSRPFRDGWQLFIRVHTSTFT